MAEAVLPHYDYWPLPSRFRFKKLRKEFENLMDEFITERMKAPERVSLQYLMATILLHAEIRCYWCTNARQWLTTQGHQNRSYRSSVSAILSCLCYVFTLRFRFAGHDSTAHTMAWALYHICADPEVYKKALEEVDAVIPGTPSVNKDTMVRPFSLVIFWIRNSPPRPPAPPPPPPFFLYIFYLTV